MVSGAALHRLDQLCTLTPLVACISRKMVSVGVYNVKIDLNILHLLATEVEGTFRVNGSTKRMRDLQAAFETPPRVRTDCSFVAL